MNTDQLSKRSPAEKNRTSSAGNSPTSSLFGILFGDQKSPETESFFESSTADKSKPVRRSESEKIRKSRHSDYKNHCRSGVLESDDESHLSNYSDYETFSEIPSFTSSHSETLCSDISYRNFEREMNVSSRRSTAISGPKCEFCNETIKSGDSFILPCSHAYHKQCITANYAVHVVMEASGPYTCKVESCGKIVPKKILSTFKYKRTRDGKNESNGTANSCEVEKEEKTSSSGRPQSFRHSKTLIEHCGICKESLHIEPTFELPCKHVFHKSCLKLKCPFRIHYVCNFHLFIIIFLMS